MISTIPPRPVSVNSLARASVSTIPYSKSNRCTSADYQSHDDPSPPLPPPSAPGQLACQSPLDTDMDEVVNIDALETASVQPELRFEGLPTEIHEAILDYLFGERTSALTTAGPGKPSARSWNKSLRHPRRKALSNLSLISPVWRSLVQERIYRHS